MFVRLKEWSLAHLKTVSYAPMVAGGKYPRKYGLSCNAWTDVPDADAELLDKQHPGRLVLSKTAEKIKPEKVVFANVSRTKGADPQNPKAFTKRGSTKKAAAPGAPGMPDVPDEDESIEAGGGTAEGGTTGAGPEGTLGA